MKIAVRCLLIAWAVGFVSAQNAGVPYEDYFLDQSLRVDLYFAGDAKEEAITLDSLHVEPVWAGSRAALIEPFERGRNTVKVYEIASNRLIYKRGFDTMFGEYRTTAPALAGVKRVFPRSVCIPLPKRSVLFVIESRDRTNIPHPVFTTAIDPSDYHIIRESPATGDMIYEALKNGDPQDKVDLVFLAEGYTLEDKDKFKSDVDRFMGLLFKVEPYKSAKASFNIRGVFRPSPERGMDEPRQGRYRRTVLDASFNAFDLDRYMLIEQGHRLRAMAGQVPYDAIVVLVNSPRYGGGGIYNDYAVSTVDNRRVVFIHEFGHSFAGLADEYYASEVSYNDFYPKGVEPLEPNITALLDPANVKWKHLLSPGIAVPTEYGKDRMEAVLAEAAKNRQAGRDELDRAKQDKLPEAKIKAIQEKYRKLGQEAMKKIGDIRKEYADLEDKVGVFEGAGYAAKGLYRSQIYCIMISSPKQEFCAVCREAIRRMITFYGGQAPDHPDEARSGRASVPEFKGSGAVRYKYRDGWL
jgi:hypothetical protein